ncbi:MAG: hypothetical protein KKA62_01260 [Nanoarchaeota archaeon]|nr:hypothetical protein [Nanoarchaeota archaeon]
MEPNNHNKNQNKNLDKKKNFNFFLRHTAVKSTIKNILLSDYIQENEDNLNYILTPNKETVFRVNVMAVIVNKEKQGSITNFLIDDGTGKIILRSFEEDQKINLLDIGNLILIIGRVRIYNQEKYLSPEIIKKTRPLWLKLRSLELNITKEQCPEEEKIEIDSFLPKSINKKEVVNKLKVEFKKEPLEKTKEQDQEKNKEDKINLELRKNLPFTASKEDLIEEIIDEETVAEDSLEINEEDSLLPVQKLSKLIQELDQGEGVLIEEVIEKSPLDKTEELIEKMLLNGDIFQNMPGKIKVL